MTVIRDSGCPELRVPWPRIGLADPGRTAKDEENWKALERWAGTRGCGSTCLTVTWPGILAEAVEGSTVRTPKWYGNTRTGIRFIDMCVSRHTHVAGDFYISLAVNLNVVAQVLVTGASTDPIRIDTGAILGPNDFAEIIVDMSTGASIEDLCVQNWYL